MPRILVALVVWSVGGVALAGEAHGSMPCARCHIGNPKAGNSLRPAGELALCLSCHGQFASATSVLAEPPASVGRGARAMDRSAGAFQVGGRGGGHVMGSTAPPPGFDGTWPAGHRLTCRSCHAVHGNGNYRNLGPDPYLKDPAYLELSTRIFGGRPMPSYAVVPDARAARGWQGADVFVTATPGNDGRSYDSGSVVFSTNGGRNAMNAFCASCHPRFHGAANTRSDSFDENGEPTYVRHPTSGVVLEGRTKEAFDRAAHPPRVNWRENGEAEVGCLTCHRAHGSGNEFGLVFWDPRVAENGVDGAGKGVETLCASCHVLEDR